MPRICNSICCSMFWLVESLTSLIVLRQWFVAISRNRWLRSIKNIGGAIDIVAALVHECWKRQHFAAPIAHQAVQNQHHAPVQGHARPQRWRKHWHDHDYQRRYDKHQCVEPGVSVSQQRFLQRQVTNVVNDENDQKRHQEWKHIDPIHEGNGTQSSNENEQQPEKEPNPATKGRCIPSNSERYLCCHFTFLSLCQRLESGDTRMTASEHLLVNLVQLRIKQ